MAQKLPSIDIKGKQYVLVSERVLHFNEKYPDGYIVTELVSAPTSEMIIIQATVYPDAKNAQRRFTGYSQAVIGEGMVNKTAALENAETSAVGRALGFMGIGVIESIASADEMVKAKTNTMKYATEKQIQWMRSEAAQVSGYEEAGDIDKWVEEVLTIPIDKVPVFKVKDAVDKIKSQKEERKSEPINIDDIDTDKPITLDDIPY